MQNGSYRVKGSANINKVFDYFEIDEEPQDAAKLRCLGIVREIAHLHIIIGLQIRTHRRRQQAAVRPLAGIQCLSAGVIKPDAVVIFHLGGADELIDLLLGGVIVTGIGFGDVDGQRFQTLPQRRLHRIPVRRHCHADHHNACQQDTHKQQ